MSARPGMPYDRASEPTLASTWHAVSSGTVTDELLDWPPDVFALANVILARSEAFRFALSPIGEWPPEGYPDWGRMVEEAGLCWGAWVEHRRGPPPELVGQEWLALKDRVDMPLEHLAEGLDERVCVALLTLHAMADEACAGLGVALDTSDAMSSVYRGRGRELLVRTGSMARVDPRLLKVLPRSVRHPLQAGLLSVPLRAGPRHPGLLAQDARPPPRHGPALRVRDAAAIAVAARGQRLGLSADRGRRAEIVEGPVRLL